jgi:4-amino-4-deoxy-L-arabinose transferase-like glycosyltransferase
MSTARKYAIASFCAGVLTPVGLIALSWLTADNFLAEGADTTLSRIFIAPVECASKLFYRVFGISGWSLFFLTATVSILTLTCFYYLAIRWALVPFFFSRRQKSSYYEP